MNILNNLNLLPIKNKNDKQNDDKSILFIFFGETFRNGGQMKRNRSDDDITINNQFLCTESHLKLIQSLKEKKI